MVHSTEALNKTIRHLNQHRYAQHGALPADIARLDEGLFAASARCLAVYGSLMPGRENHYLLDGFSGTWEDGVVRGYFFDGGWAEGTGYPYIHWDPAGEEIPVAVLVSDNLPGHWGQLDAFEGEAYTRILVPVFQAGEVRWVANIYQSAYYTGQ